MGRAGRHHLDSYWNRSMTRETDGIIWRPTPEVARRSRIGGLMRAHGIATLADLQDRSVRDPEWYWDAVVRDLGIRWTTPYTRVLDDSRGEAWPIWFPGGRLNLAENCLDRHVEKGRGPAPAVIWEGDDGRSRTLTYAQLAAEVNRLANALPRLGVGEGDRVGIFLPMSPEAVIATLAVAKIGAIYTPCFSGFGAGAVASRLSDCEATLVITADGFRRRGQVVKLKETADEAVARCPSVKTVLVHRALGREIPWTKERDRWWHEAVADESDHTAARQVEADRPCLIIYTSGTTGRPKGAVLTHGGFLVKTAHDFAYCMDVGEQDRLFWLTDLGWLMGPMAITAALFHGGTAVLFEGVPDHPGPDRLWTLVERHRISVMGMSPTAVRALMVHGPQPVEAHDLSSLRILGSTGEPWNPEPYRWLFEHVGKGRLPIINYTGGTEISGGILGCFPTAPIKSCAFTGPIPGMAAECFGENGEPVRGQVGELVIKKPWPGMTAGFWRDPARYEETYWSRWPQPGSTATGHTWTTTASGSSRGARTTRSRSPASGSGRPRSSRSWSAILPSPRRASSASRTMSRERPSCASSCFAPAKRRRRLSVASCRSALPRRWARPFARRRCCSRATSRRPGAPRSCAASFAPHTSAAPPVTSRRSRTRTRLPPLPTRGDVSRGFRRIAADHLWLSRRCPSDGVRT